MVNLGYIGHVFCGSENNDNYRERVAIAYAFNTSIAQMAQIARVMRHVRLNEDTFERLLNTRMTTTWEDSDEKTEAYKHGKYARVALERRAFEEKYGVKPSPKSAMMLAGYIVK